MVEALQARGHEVRTPDDDSTAVLHAVHTPRYLAFLESAWSQWLALDPANGDRQPFPSVWPVRTLRSDVEPANFIARLGLYSMDNGSPLSAGTWTAAKAGADAAVSAAGLLTRGTPSVFCATRPPGHHAGADFMGGYCFVNNAAVAAQALLNRGCERVAILDVDYHHGNGTQSIFYERADVLFVSIHGDPRTEYPFYLGPCRRDRRGGRSRLQPEPAARGGCVDERLVRGARDRVRPRRAPSARCRRRLARSRHVRRRPDLDLPAARRGLHAPGRPAQADRSVPSLFVLEGGYAASELGTNAANVADGFEQG